MASVFAATLENCSRKARDLVMLAAAGAAVEENRRRQIDSRVSGGCEYSSILDYDHKTTSVKTR